MSLTDFRTLGRSGLGVPPAQVALAWVANRPGVSSTLVGASRAEQLRDNLAALDLQLSPAHLAALDQASAPEAVSPYPLFTPAGNQGVFGGARVQGWR